MKKIILTISASAVLILSLLSCDKYHRNRYVGDWDFTTIRCFCAGSIYEPELLKTDTVYYSGKIEIGVPEWELLIKYTENDEIQAWVNKKEESKNVFLYTKDIGSFYGKYPSGEFERKDKMHLSLRWYNFQSVENYDMKFENIVGVKRKGSSHE